jgi:hypothetical protein
VYRYGADQLGLSVDSNLAMIVVPNGTNGAYLQWDTNLTDTSSSAANPAIIGTDSDTGIIAQTRALDFVENGTAFAGIRTSGTGSNYGGFCLNASNTAPCLQNYLISSGKFILTSPNTGNWGGTIDLGDDGGIATSRSVSTPTGYTFENDNDTGFGGSADTSISVGGGGASQTSITATIFGPAANTSFIYVDKYAGAPTAGDCDADAERGRLALDTTNSRLYLCGGATRLWDYITLIDAAGI